LISHFLGDYFTFDSKIFKSLIPLLLKPGFLTTEYMAGRRVRYIPPVRFYVFISILFFVLSSFQPFLSDVSPDIIVNGEYVTETDELPPQITEEYDAIKKKIAEFLSAGNAEFEQLLLSKLNRFQKNTAGFEAAFNRNLPKVMFFLLPIVALVLRLLYARSGRLLIEHFIFSLHLHSFLFLILSLNIPLELLFSNTSADWVSDLVSIPILAYLFISMKRHYGQAVGKTIGKFTALLAMYLLAVAVALSGLFLHTFFTA
jgi:hypothetical protein